jgi:hypothetical protein
VRSLPDPLELAWQDLRNEFDVQSKIWESLAMLRGRDIPEELLELHRQANAVFDAATFDLIEPIEDLEAILQNEWFDQEFSRAFEASAQNVIAAEAVSSKRVKLVDHLEDFEEDFHDSDAPGSMKYGRTDEDNAMMEELLKECRFEDCKLEYRLRQFLRVGLRSALRNSQASYKKTVRFDLQPDCRGYDPLEGAKAMVSDCLFIRMSTDGTCSL